MPPKASLSSCRISTLSPPSSASIPHPSSLSTNSHRFNGDTAPNTNTTIHSESSPSFIERVKLGIAEAAKSFQIDMWLARHTPATVLPHLHRLLAALRDEFADAVANGDGIYAVGYSFGAKYVLLLGSDLGDEMATGQREGSQESKAEEGKMKGPAIKVGALAHGIIDREDFVHLKVPVGMVCVEGDPLFSDEAREEGVKIAKQKGVEVESWVYPGVPHGECIPSPYYFENKGR